MTLYIDKRKGSRELFNYLRDPGVPKELAESFIDGDFEFPGWGPDDAPIIVGGEYKTFTECLTAMNDGRIYGTQIARMLGVYQRVYLIIEGRTRVNRDGVLEYFVGYKPGRGKSSEREIWYTAYGRDGRGWTSREFHGRIESIEEFPGVRVRFAEDKQGSAVILQDIYRYWTKLYSEHRSWMAWDQSCTGRPASAGNLLIPTSNLPLVTRCARELVGVGQTKAHFVGAHFGTLAQMAMAGAEDWGRVAVETRIKNGPRKGQLRTQHFSAETVERIMSEIWTGSSPGPNNGGK